MFVTLLKWPFNRIVPDLQKVHDYSGHKGIRRRAVTHLSAGQGHVKWETIHTTVKLRLHIGY